MSMTDIFFTGRMAIGALDKPIQFEFWITEPVFTSYKKEDLADDKDPYYSCSLTELKYYKDSSGKDFACHYYINLVDKLKQIDNYFNFARPNDKINDEKEIQHWSSNKDLQMPMWNLKRSTIKKIVKILVNLNEKGESLLTVC